MSKIHVVRLAWNRRLVAILLCRLDYDRGVCDHLIDQDLEAALKAIEGDEQVKPNKFNNYI
jgi:hypothetical protein